MLNAAFLTDEPIAQPQPFESAHPEPNAWEVHQGQRTFVRRSGHVVSRRRSP
jgi:hypothetical protein